MLISLTNASKIDSEQYLFSRSIIFHCICGVIEVSDKSKANKIIIYWKCTKNVLDKIDKCVRMECRNRGKPKLWPMMGRVSCDKLCSCMNPRLCIIHETDVAFRPTEYLHIARFVFPRLKLSETTFSRIFFPSSSRKYLNGTRLFLAGISCGYFLRLFLAATVITRGTKGERAGEGCQGGRR